MHLDPPELIHKTFCNQQRLPPWQSCISLRCINLPTRDAVPLRCILCITKLLSTGYYTVVFINLSTRDVVPPTCCCSDASPIPCWCFALVHHKSYFCLDLDHTMVSTRDAVAPPACWDASQPRVLCNVIQSQHHRPALEILFCINLFTRDTVACLLLQCIPRVLCYFTSHAW